MRAGSLNKKVEFQSLTKTKNSFKEVVDGWTKFAEAYVSILPLKSSEKFLSKKTSAEVTHKILMRFMDGIKPSMQIVHGSRVFKIDGIINVREENKTLQITASEDI